MVAKIDLKWTEDFRGIPCLKVSRKKGKLYFRDVYEKLQENYKGTMFVQIATIEEFPVEDICEDEEAWYFYKVTDIVPMLVRYNGGIKSFPADAVEQWKQELREEG